MAALSLWLCSYAAKWLCGYVATWPFGHVAMWLCGRKHRGVFLERTTKVNKIEVLIYVTSGPPDRLGPQIRFFPVISIRSQITQVILLLIIFHQICNTQYLLIDKSQLMN